jgi:hypothetical protein
LSIHPLDLPVPDDSTACAVLTVQRHLCRSFAQPGTQGWMSGLIIAIESFGSGTGPALFATIAAQMQAMRQARGALFTYADPLCPGCRARMTPDEQQLTLCLRALRQGRVAAAGRHALVLCEGEPPTRFLDATAQLADLLPRLATPRLN